jgi:hypothetical protein
MPSETGTDVHAQVARLLAERNLLLQAIAGEDYEKIQAKLVKISETPDSALVEVPLTDEMSPAVRNAMWRFNAALTIRKLREALRKIDAWELPETGETWPDSNNPMSYEASHGSEGAKRYIRNIAHEALKEK